MERRISDWEDPYLVSNGRTGGVKKAFERDKYDVCPHEINSNIEARNSKQISNDRNPNDQNVLMTQSIPNEKLLHVQNWDIRISDLLALLNIAMTLWSAFMKNTTFEICHGIIPNDLTG